METRGLRLDEINGTVYLKLFDADGDEQGEIEWGHIVSVSVPNGMIDELYEIREYWNRLEEEYSNS